MIVLLLLTVGILADTPPSALAASSAVLKVITTPKPTDGSNVISVASIDITNFSDQNNAAAQSSAVATPIPTQPQPTNPTIVLNSNPAKGLISSIKKIYLSAPPKSAVFTDYEYTDKGNVRHTKNKRYYFQKVIVSEEEVLAKIDPSLPESSDLEESKNVAPAFNGLITPPFINFQNWDGVATAIVEELNLVRTNPALYSNFVEQQLATFIDDKTYRQGMYLTRSNEGKSAWQEASNFLKFQAPVNRLRRVSCLDASATIMVTDAVKNNIIGYVDTKRRTPFERMKETCKINDGSESIAYGFMSARLAIIQLLVDDSVSDRNHRLTLFKNFTQVGVAARAFPPDFASIVIMDFLY